MQNKPLQALTQTEKLFKLGHEYSHKYTPTMSFTVDDARSVVVVTGKLGPLPAAKLNGIEVLKAPLRHPNAEWELNNSWYGRKTTVSISARDAKHYTYEVRRTDSDVIGDALSGSGLATIKTAYNYKGTISCSTEETLGYCMLLLTTEVPIKFTDLACYKEKGMLPADSMPALTYHGMRLLVKAISSEHNELLNINSFSNTWYMARNILCPQDMAYDSMRLVPAERVKALAEAGNTTHLLELGHTARMRTALPDYRQTVTVVEHGQEVQKPAFGRGLEPFTLFEPVVLGVLPQAGGWHGVVHMVLPADKKPSESASLQWRDRVGSEDRYASILNVLALPFSLTLVTTIKGVHAFWSCRLDDPASHIRLAEEFHALRPDPINSVLAFLDSGYSLKHAVQLQGLLPHWYLTDLTKEITPAQRNAIEAVDASHYVNASQLVQALRLRSFTAEQRAGWLAACHALVFDPLVQAQYKWQDTLLYVASAAPLTVALEGDRTSAGALVPVPEPLVLPEIAAATCTGYGLRSKRQKLAELTAEQQEQQKHRAAAIQAAETHNKAVETRANMLAALEKVNMWMLPTSVAVKDENGQDKVCAVERTVMSGSGWAVTRTVMEEVRRDVLPRRHAQEGHMNRLRAILAGYNATAVPAGVTFVPGVDAVVKLTGQVPAATHVERYTLCKEMGRRRNSMGLATEEGEMAVLYPLPVQRALLFDGVM